MAELEKPTATQTTNGDADHSSAASDRISHSEKPAATQGEVEKAKGTTYLPQSDDDYVVTFVLHSLPLTSNC